MKVQVIREVCIEAEWDGTIYQVVRLRGGLHAFAWSSRGYNIGDQIGNGTIDNPTTDHGAAIYATFREAERAFRQCAASIGQTDLEGERHLLEGGDESDM